VYSFDIADRAQRAGIRLVRFLWCGTDGTTRAIASAIHDLEGRMDSGLALPVVAQATNVLGEELPLEGLWPAGELRVAPDFETYRVLPYAPHTAALVCDLNGLDGEPSSLCPRSFLKRMVERLEAQEASVRASFENEFVLAQAVDGGHVPLGSSRRYASVGLSVAQGYLDELAGAATDQELELERCHAATGPGQYEVSTAGRLTLEAADRQLLLRETIRGVAPRHGLAASLAPTPWPGEDTRSESHLHVSLWDDIAFQNRFHDDDHPGELAPDGRAFLAGVLEHLPGLCSLAAPSFGSYARRATRSASGAFACWGLDNRRAPLRLPPLFRDQESTTAHFELRVCDASCNPYLALGGVIAAGLDGLARKLELPEPVDVDPGTLSAAERKRRGIGPLPQSQIEALDALEGDDVLVGALGDQLARVHAAVRRSESDAFSGGDEELEHRVHFTAY
jgi:glutamine synthetase